MTPTQELEQDLTSGLSEAELKQIEEGGRKADLPMTDYEKSKKGIENALLRGRLWDEETKSWV